MVHAGLMSERAILVMASQQRQPEEVSVGDHQALAALPSVRDVCSGGRSGPFQMLQMRNWMQVAQILLHNMAPADSMNCSGAGPVLGRALELQGRADTSQTLEPQVLCSSQSSF